MLKSNKQTPSPESAEDRLFSTQRIADAKAQDPLIVMGLPRSGSSFLSEVISQIEGWYVFDDLYLHRKALQIGARTPLSQRDMGVLLDFLGWQIRARLRWGSYAIPAVAEDEIDPMNESLNTSFRAAPGNWADL